MALGEGLAPNADILPKEHVGELSQLHHARPRLILELHLARRPDGKALRFPAAGAFVPPLEAPPLGNGLSLGGCSWVAPREGI